MKTTTDYNMNITPLWETDTGNFKSIKIGPEQFDQLQKIEQGGVLLVKKLLPKSRKNETSPHAYLEYISPKQMADFAKNSKTKNFDDTSSLASDDSDL